MKVVSKKRVQSFFDVNGMDTLSANSLSIVKVADGVEYVSESEANDYLYNSYFSAMWRDFSDYCNSIEM